MQDWRQLTFQTDLSLELFFTKDRTNQNRFYLFCAKQKVLHQKRPGCSIKHKVVHFSTTNKFSCELACLNKDRQIQM